jgi:glutathione synthase/RimK-type ligase-like ATP-grasp enzyme
LSALEHLKRLLPDRLKTAFLRCVPYERYSRYVWVRDAPFPGIEERSTYAPQVDVRLGIIKSHNFWHQYYSAACRELGVPYCTIDIERDDWMDQVRSSGCDLFLVWPTPFLSIWKQLYDERLAIIAGPLGKLVYPDLQAMWIYESKRRMNYWLAATGFPRPETWVFYDRREAMRFAETADLPIVTKTDLGSMASGVWIIRSRWQLRRAVRRAFGSGIVPRGSDRRDAQWGNIIFQRFVPGAREWRIIRIGDSYFGYEKLQVGDFHSGTAKWRYVRPPDELLNLTRELTDRGGFTSMSVDILVDEAGDFFVNELQGVFGMLNDYACMVEGKVGRMLRDTQTGRWRFEEGDFCRNRMCNLRVQVVVEMLRAHSTGKAPSQFLSGMLSPTSQPSKSSRTIAR